MKTSIKTVNYTFLALVLFFGLYSCVSKTPFLHSTIVPAADGYVTVNQDKNKNYQVKVDVRNLAEADKLDPARKTYVVWMEAGDRTAKNLGQMKSSTGMISKVLKASFQTVTPEKPRKIFITAEDDGDVQFPGAQVILSTGNL
jgi:hypothetical protein